MSRKFFLALAWIGLFAARPALAQGVRFLAPAAGAAFSAGDEVEIRWQGAAERWDEVELLLSLDDGRSFPVRLTHELPGEATAYVWRVPSLPSGVARLSLRAGVRGREEVVGTSGAFAIEIPASRVARPPKPHRFRGELWIHGSAPGMDGEWPSPAPDLRGTEPILDLPVPSLAADLPPAFGAQLVKPEVTKAPPASSRSDRPSAFLPRDTVRITAPLRR